MTRIVVIDDEEDIRSVLKLILERAGFEVEVAANSDVPEDRVTAKKRIGQLDSPFRIATATFSASVDEAGIRLNSTPKARTAFVGNNLE